MALTRRPKSRFSNSSSKRHSAFLADLKRQQGLAAAAKQEVDAFMKGRTGKNKLTYKEALGALFILKDAESKDIELNPKLAIKISKGTISAFTMGENRGQRASAKGTRTA